MSIGIYIMCDGCQEQPPCTAPGGVHAGPTRPPAHALRAAAKATGWRTGVTSMHGHQSGGWRDFCAACWLRAHPPAEAHSDEREPLTDCTGCDV